MEAHSLHASCSWIIARAAKNSTRALKQLKQLLKEWLPPVQLVNQHDVNAIRG